VEAEAAVFHLHGVAEASALEAKAARDAAAFQQRRADEFFSIIEGVEMEANSWRRLYMEGMTTSAAAQNWLFRELGRAVKIANRYSAALKKNGIAATEIEIDPELVKIHKKFEALRGQPTPARAPGFPEAQAIQDQYLQARGRSEGTEDA
jgi:hypothetical protein